MVHEVITPPLRIGAKAARSGLRVVGRAITLGLSAAERLIDTAIPRGDGAAGAPDRAEASTSAAAAAPPSGNEPAPTPTSMAPVPPAASEAPSVGAAPAPTPAHVSRDVRHVEAFADPGAEDGVGAAVHIEEPWRGYGHMTANDIITRLTTASSEELAAVALYERAHRDRRTVVAAAERELRRASAAPRRPG